MKKIGSLGLLFTLAFVGLANAQTGQIDARTFISTSLAGKTIPVYTYLPPGYSTEGDPYPVYIFLHGAGGDRPAYHITAFRNTLDPLINDGTIAPMVVVFPEIRGDVPGYQPLFFEIHMYKNSARNGLFEDAVIVDLLSWLYTQSGYNVSSERGKRAIGGFSDGAVGSSFLAITHSDLFTAFVAHSGELALRETEGYVPILLAEAGGAPPYTFDPADGDYSLYFFGRASAMSPNLVNPNYPAYFLDFPVDAAGSLISAVFEDQWIAHNDPGTLIVDSLPLHIFFSCNTGDENLAFNDQFAQDLTGLGISYVYETFPGGHSLNATARRDALIWLNDQFHAPPTSVEEGAARLPALALGQNYPNPFRGKTVIPFRLPRGGNVDLSVYNVLGQRVKRLAAGHREPGDYQIPFDPSGLAGGTYWYQLKVGDRHAAKRMQLTR